jgi:hypothetical protein
MNQIEVMLPISISVLALIVSGLTLYLSHLRPARIRIVAGESVHLHYFEEGNFGITLPVSFVNQGARIGTVSRVALLIQKNGSDEGYLLEPHAYQRLDSNQNFLHESTASPISVPSKSNILKQVLFKSSVDRPDDFKIVSGKFDLFLFGWTEGSIRPSAMDEFSIEVSEPVVHQLDEWHKKKITYTIGVLQSKWRKWSAHRLTEIEINTLQKNIKLRD